MVCTTGRGPNVVVMSRPTVATPVIHAISQITSYLLGLYVCFISLTFSRTLDWM